MPGRFPPPGAPALNCPGCNRKVAEDTAICPHCDHIIDESFLGGSGDEGNSGGSDESTGVRPAPRSRPPPARAAPEPRARPAPARARTGARPAAPPPSDDATNVRSMEDIAREKAQRSAPARASGSVKAARAPARRAPVPAPVEEEEDDAGAAVADPWSREARELESSRAPIDDPEVLLDDARAFLRELEGGDRIAFWGAALVVLSCFMPWKETAADGDFLGLISLGFISFLFAVATMVFVGLRTRQVMTWVNPMLPWGAQMVCSVITLVWSLVFLKLSSDTTLVPSPLGNSEMMNSSPSIGCFLGILGGVIAVLGGLMGLKRQE